MPSGKVPFVKCCAGRAQAGLCQQSKCRSRDICWECAFVEHIGRAIRRNVGASVSENGYPLLLGMNFPKRIRALQWASHDIGQALGVGDSSVVYY